MVAQLFYYQIGVDNTCFAHPFVINGENITLMLSLSTTPFTPELKLKLEPARSWLVWEALIRNNNYYRLAFKWKLQYLRVIVTLLFLANLTFIDGRICSDEPKIGCLEVQSNGKRLRCKPMHFLMQFLALVLKKNDKLTWASNRNSRSKSKLCVDV